MLRSLILPPADLKGLGLQLGLTIEEVEKLVVHCVNNEVQAEYLGDDDSD